MHSPPRRPGRDGRQTFHDTRRVSHQKPIWSPKPAGNCAKNRFEARNPPRIASKIDLKPETRRGLHQKPIRSPKPAKDCVKNRFGPKTSLGLGQKLNLSPRRPSFWAKNQFGACGEGHFTPKTGFKPAATLVLGQKRIWNLRRGSFHSTRVGAYPAYAPQTSRQGRAPGHIYSAPRGRLMGRIAYALQTSRQGRAPDAFIRPRWGPSNGAYAIRPYTGTRPKFAGVRRRPHIPPAG